MVLFTVFYLLLTFYFTTFFSFNSCSFAVCAVILRYEQKAKNTEEIWDELGMKGMKIGKFILFLWTLLERALSGKVYVNFC